MLDSYGRSLYQKALVNPILPTLSGLSPSMLTLFALLSGVMILPLLAFQYTLLAFLFLCLSGFLDTLDGSLARYQNKSTPDGAVFDITADRIVEFSVILGLYFFNPEMRSLSCLLMLGSILFCITSFLVVGIFTPNLSEKGFYYSPGLIERGEAFIFFSLMILFPAAFLQLSSLFTTLVFLTAGVRLKQFILK